MSKQEKTELDKKFEAARNQLRQKSILEVAQALGMSFNGNEWTEHDSFKLDFKKNRASWYSQGEDYRNMDVFELVMKMRDVPYRDAYQFVKTGDFKQLEIKHEPKEPFEYQLKPFEDATFSAARTYLKNERQLSDETIDFFIDKEVLVQATRRTNVSDVVELAGNYYYDPVVAFKVLDRDKTIIGTSLVGIGDKAVYSLPGTPVKRKQIGWNSDGLGGLNISIGTPKRIVIVEAPIDLMSYYELHKNELQNVMLVALDGSGTKMSTVKRYVLDLASNGQWSQSLDRLGLAAAFDMVLENTDLFKKRENLITVAVDNDDAGKKMVSMFEEQGIPVVVDLPPLHEGQTKNDWNDELKYIKGGKVVTTTQELETEKETQVTDNREKYIRKAPDLSQEPNSSIGGTFNRNPSSLSVNFAKVVPQPDEQAQPNFLTDDLLYFTTNNSKIKVRRDGYFPIKPNELRKLNLIAPSLQKTAQFYMQNLSGRTINYVYKDGPGYSNMAVKFEDENFMHLTGIMPYVENNSRTASQTLKDFAEGRGDFDNLLVSSAFKDKLMVLPLIPEIVDSKSFVLDDLSEVEKLKRLHLDKAIKTEDEDLLVAFRDVEGIGMPASVIKLKANSNLKLQINEHVADKTILAVLSEQDGIVETLSVNDDFIQDNGIEIKTIIGDNQEVETANDHLDNEETVTSSQVLDEEVGLENPESLESNVDQLENETSTSEDIETEQVIRLQPAQNIIDAARAKDIKALSVHLKDGIKQYLNSDQYKLFLDAMSKFHRYSPKNVQMILAQKPDAELIAPAGRWKSEFERFPAKGSKAIYIWDYREKLSKTSDGKVILDENGKPKKESYFILAPKFDVSQTTGKDIPKAVYELEDGKAFDQVHAANLYRSLKSVSEAKGVPVSFENISNGANGFYSPMEHAITINKGMGQTQTLKTLIHEMAHSDLHNNKAREAYAYTYSNQELQAESVAYVVAQHYGIDTSSYSFGYLANWSNDKVGLSDLEAQLKVVHIEAKDLITRIDTAMEKVVEVQTSKAASNPFKAKLQEEKEKATQAKEVAGDDQIKKDQGVHRQESGRTL